MVGPEPEKEMEKSGRGRSYCILKVQRKKNATRREVINAAWTLSDVRVSSFAPYTSNFFSSFLLSEKLVYRVVDTHINLYTHVCKHTPSLNYAQKKKKKPSNSNSFNFLPPSLNFYLNPCHTKDS